MPPERAPDVRTYAAFFGAMVIGGANFIAVSLSNQELPPFFGAALRFGIASALLVAWAGTVRAPWPERRGVLGAALYGVLGIGVAYALLYTALIGLAAGTASVVVATAPLFTLGFAVLMGQEHVTARGIGGGLLAIAGIAILSTGTIGVADWRFLAAALGGTMAAALSSVVAKANPGVRPIVMNAIGTVAGTLLLVVASLAVGEVWALPTATPAVLAVAWLATIGTVGLFQLILYVIRQWTASASVYATTGMPVVATLLGALMLDQPITLAVVAGSTLVIAAVFVGVIAGSGRRQS